MNIIYVIYDQAFCENEYGLLFVPKERKANQAIFRKGFPPLIVPVDRQASFVAGCLSGM